MRIKNGKNFKYLYQYPSNPRQKKFRQLYQINDIVQGYVLEYIGKKFAIIRIEDMNLLADIRPGYPEGKILSFQVIALYPEIRLQEVDLTDRDGINILV
ncbi:MAG: hypothetical protein ACQES5_01185 [Thermodesulfobacteriota bacterium]